MSSKFDKKYLSLNIFLNLVLPWKLSRYWRNPLYTPITNGSVCFSREHAFRLTIKSNDMELVYLQSWSVQQVGGNAELSSASVAGFVVEEAVQQPGGVERVHHEDPEQQLRERAPFPAAVRRFQIARGEHDSFYNWVQRTQCMECSGMTSNRPTIGLQHPSGFLNPAAAGVLMLITNLCACALVACWSSTHTLQKT